MGVFTGTLHYDCKSDTTTATIHTGPGTPAFVQKVNFKLFPNQSGRYTVDPNGTFKFVIPGKVTSLTAYRIDFYWHDADGDHYASHPDTQLSYTGETECPVETTTTAKRQTTTTVVVTTTKPGQTTTTVRCEEDEPCWDCSTMGNKICGTTVPPTGRTLPPTGNGQGTSTALPFTGVGLILVGALLVKRIRRLAR